jgi:hypothetical protein
MATYYVVPKCCCVQWNNAGRYEVAHTETDPCCRHTPSGGTGGRQDGVTPCNRIIGHGRTVAEAVRAARLHLGLNLPDDVE